MVQGVSRIALAAVALNVVTRLAFANPDADFTSDVVAREEPIAERSMWEDISTREIMEELEARGLEETESRELHELAARFIKSKKAHAPKGVKFRTMKIGGKKAKVYDHKGHTQLFDAYNVLKGGVMLKTITLGGEDVQVLENKKGHQEFYEPKKHGKKFATVYVDGKDHKFLLTSKGKLHEPKAFKHFKLKTVTLAHKKTKAYVDHHGRMRLKEPMKFFNHAIMVKHAKIGGKKTEVLINKSGHVEIYKPKKHGKKILTVKLNNKDARFLLDKKGKLYEPKKWTGLKAKSSKKHGKTVTMLKVDGKFKEYQPLEQFDLYHPEKHGKHRKGIAHKSKKHKRDELVGDMVEREIMEREEPNDILELRDVSYDLEELD